MNAELMEQCQRAAQAIDQCDALLITAGAGMGVDSGLPDFRGPEGFWRAFPPLKKLGLRFEQMAQPQWFVNDRELAWGFYGMRSRLYAEKTPHAGYSILKKWSDAMPAGSFVFTSNVDGHFERAGFDENYIVECHGTLLYWQAIYSSDQRVEPMGELEFDINPDTLRAEGNLPKLSDGTSARPNVLLFNDYSWVSARTDAQEERFHIWLAPRLKSGKLAIVELGAGLSVPTIRHTSEQLFDKLNSSLIRINLRDPQTPRGGIGISASAMQALQTIDEFRVPAPSM